MPTLSTDRTILTPITPEEIDLLHRHWNNDQVRRFLWDDQPVSRETVVAIVDGSREQFALEGSGIWSVRDRESREMIGSAGYWRFHEPPRLELIISLDPERWGVGIAREVGERLMLFGYEELGMDQVLASTDAPNLRSLHLIERLGFTLQEERVANGLPTRFFSRARNG